MQEGRALAFYQKGALVGHDRQHDGLDRLIRSSLAGGGAGDAGACPEADTVAAYGEDRLGTEERRSLEVHLASCARCQDVLALIARDAPRPAEIAGPQPSPSTHRPWFSSLRWAVPVAAAAVAVTVYVAVRPQLSGPPDVAQAPPVATMASRLDAPKGGQPSPDLAEPVERSRRAEPLPGARAPESRLEAAPVAPPPATLEAGPPPLREPSAAEKAPDAPVVLASGVPVASTAPPSPPPTVADAVAMRPAAGVEVLGRSQPALANAAPAAAALSPGAAMTGTSPFERSFADADVVVLARAYGPAADGTPFEVVEVFKRPNDLPPAGRIVLSAATGTVRPGEQYVLFLRRREPADAVLEPVAERGVVRVGDKSGPLLAFLRQQAGMTRR